MEQLHHRGQCSSRAHLHRRGGHTRGASAQQTERRENASAGGWDHCYDAVLHVLHVLHMPKPWVPLRLCNACDKQFFCSRALILTSQWAPLSLGRLQLRGCSTGRGSISTEVSCAGYPELSWLKPTG
jgi:hypothetical protein